MSTKGPISIALLNLAMDNGDETLSNEPDQPAYACYPARNRAQIARALAGDIERRAWVDAAWAAAPAESIALLPPPGYRHPVTGRHQLQADPGLERVGRYLRRARLYVGKSQQRVANESGVTQSSVSRAERGLAPALRLGRFVRLCQPLGRLFPFGVCPHEHNCAWQPITPPERVLGPTAQLIEYILESGGVDD